MDAHNFPARPCIASQTSALPGLWLEALHTLYPEWSQPFQQIRHAPSACSNQLSSPNACMRGGPETLSGLIERLTFELAQLLGRPSWRKQLYQLLGPACSRAKCHLHAAPPFAPHLARNTRAVSFQLFRVKGSLNGSPNGFSGHCITVPSCCGICMFDRILEWSSRGSDGSSRGRADPARPAGGAQVALLGGMQSYRLE